MFLRVFVVEWNRMARLRRYFFAFKKRWAKRIAQWKAWPSASSAWTMTFGHFDLCKWWNQLLKNKSHKKGGQRWVSKKANLRYDFTTSLWWFMGIPICFSFSVVCVLALCFCLGFFQDLDQYMEISEFFNAMKEVYPNLTDNELQMLWRYIDSNLAKVEKWSCLKQTLN